MITKFEKYNESIRDLLVGPTKEEIWKSLGWDEPFDTAKDFFLNVFHNFNETKIRQYMVWKDIVCKKVISYDTLNERVECYLGYYTQLMEKMFDLTNRDVIVIIEKILKKQLNLKNSTQFSFIVSAEYAEYYDENNESIKSLLVGPTKEEVWDNLGYDRVFDTPEEYFTYIFYNFQYSDKILFNKIWKNEDGMVVIDYEQYEKELYCHLYEYTKIMEKIFNLSYRNVTNIIKQILKKELHLDDNVDITFILGGGECPDGEEEY